MRFWRRLRTRKASKSRVDWSDQCRSSTTMATGACWLRRTTRPSSSSNSRAWAAWPGGPASGSPRQGSRRPNSGQDGPPSSRTASTPSWSGRGRSACTIGAYGRAPSPTGTQPPTSTRIPFVAQRAVSSATRRVLPTPASPPTRTTAGSPSAARLRAASRTSSSSIRPTKVRLAMRPPISPRLSPATNRRGTVAVKSQRPKMRNPRRPDLWQTADSRPPAERHAELASDHQPRPDAGRRQRTEGRGPCTTNTSG